MRSTAYCSLGTVVLFVSATGCGAYDGSIGDDRQSHEELGSSAGFAASDEGAFGAEEGEEDVGTDEQAFMTPRADWVKTVTVGEGHRGSWRQKAYCGEGMWAVGYSIRVQPFMSFFGDDTGLNSVRLYCASPDGAQTEQITSYDGLWGSWFDPAFCNNPNPSHVTSLITTARLKVQPPQGGGDDMGATDAIFGCSNGEALDVGNRWEFGAWSDVARCPDDSAVCGLSIRYESSQWGGDDTAMNGLKLECCSLPGPSIAEEGESCGGFKLGPPSVCADGLYCHYTLDAVCGWGDAPGECAAMPEICSNQDAPVCGCDGVTYGNACKAAASGVSVLNDGTCDEPWP